MSKVDGFRNRRFWQDTVRTDEALVVVHYEYGFLVPVVYLRGRGRVHPPSVRASEFVGPDAKDEREWIMGLISSALGAAAGAASGEKAADKELLKVCPTLHAFMCDVEEDGKARSPSSLVVFTEDGQWKGCLTEKDANLKLWRSGESFQKLLQAFEKALASGNADWRKGFVQGQARRPSGKKK
jgi:hypothetical protein